VGGGHNTLPPGGEEYSQCHLGEKFEKQEEKKEENVKKKEKRQKIKMEIDVKRVK
jgi:hypothetical protein